MRHQPLPERTKPLCRPDETAVQQRPANETRAFSRGESSQSNGRAEARSVRELDVSTVKMKERGSEAPRRAKTREIKFRVSSPPKHSNNGVDNNDNSGGSH
jgi:hypothetical protein